MFGCEVYGLTRCDCIEYYRRGHDLNVINDTMLDVRNKCHNLDIAELYREEGVAKFRLLFTVIFVSVNGGGGVFFSCLLPVWTRD